MLLEYDSQMTIEESVEYFERAAHRIRKIFRQENEISSDPDIDPESDPSTDPSTDHMEHDMHIHVHQNMTGRSMRMPYYRDDFCKNAIYTSIVHRVFTDRLVCNDCARVQNGYVDGIIQAETKMQTTKNIHVVARIEENFSFALWHICEYLVRLLEHQSHFEMHHTTKDKPIVFPFELIHLKICNGHLSHIYLREVSLPPFKEAVLMLKETFFISKQLAHCDLYYLMGSLHINRSCIVMEPSILRRSGKHDRLKTETDTDTQSETEIFTIDDGKITYHDVAYLRVISRNRQSSESSHSKHPRTESDGTDKHTHNIKCRYGYVLDFYVALVILIRVYIESAREVDKVMKTFNLIYPKVGILRSEDIYTELEGVPLKMF